MSIKALERHLQPIMPFLKIDGVTELCINHPGGLYLEAGSKFAYHKVPELEMAFLESLASLIAEFNSKDFPHPLLAGSLPTGERVQFVMNPACDDDLIVCSMRRQQMKNMLLDDYVANRALCRR